MSLYSPQTMKLYRGRLFDHINLHVRDLERSRTFYRSVAECLGFSITYEAENCFFIDELCVRQVQSNFHQVHFAFQAHNPALVRLFYETALSLGGTCNGAPSERKEGKTIFSAFVLDPDGNNIEAVYSGPVRKSAQHIEVRSHL